MTPAGTPAATDWALEDAEAAFSTALYAGAVRSDLLPLVAEVGGQLVFACAGRPRSPWKNQVVVRPGVTERALDEALGVLARGGAEVEVVSVPDGVARHLLPALLAARGFAPDAPLLRLVRPAGAPAEVPPTRGWRVAAVGPEARDEVAALCEQAFGLAEPDWWTAGLGQPGWTQVVAYEGDVPVATGGLHVGGAMGHLGGAGTVPAARGRGAQAALVAYRLRLAAEAGAGRVGVKCAPGTASHRNLLRAGFEPAHSVVQWRRDRATTTRGG